MMYLLAAVAVSGIFIAVGWRSRHTRNEASAHGRTGVPFDPLWGEAEIDTSEAHADVDTTIRLVLQRLAPAMAARSVRAEIASHPGLRVRMRSAALADLLEEFLAAAINNAPASRLLLTAACYGGWVNINLTDDVPGADLAVRLASVSSLRERAAMRGGGLDVDVLPAEGTTMTLRLAAVTAERADQSGQSPPEQRTWSSGSTGGSSIRANSQSSGTPSPASHDRAQRNVLSA